MTTAPARPGPTTPTGGGPATAHHTLPTLEQLLNLVARAERKGALNHAEGDRLRLGLLHFAGQHLCNPKEAAAYDDLHRKYRNARQAAWRWKRSATRAGWSGVRGAAYGVADGEAQAALCRVVELATRWKHVPAKRQAGVSVLAVIRNVDSP